MIDISRYLNRLQFGGNYTDPPLLILSMMQVNSRGCTP